MLNSKKTDAKRYGLIDFVRGITLISMILYHMCWDLQFMFGVNMPWYTGAPGFIWERSICIPFILLSGFCLVFSDNVLRKVKRGIIISACGMIVTFVSIFFISDDPIYFGILTFIGFAMILYAVIDKWICKLNPYIMLAVSVVLWILFANVSYGTIGINNLVSIGLPDALYSNMFTAFLGFPNPRFSSSDYFAVLPWIFLYGAGYYLGQIFKKRNLLNTLIAPVNTPINFIGKHTLPIYMIHQPIIYGILLLIFR